MKIFIAGIGSGNENFITLAALNAAKNSDIIILPRSHENKTGMAEKVISQLLPERNFITVIFPMIQDQEKRNEVIYSQLEKINFQGAQKIFFPVIGDSMLYSTGAYFIESMKKIFPEYEVNFIPGISAHSVASAAAKKFLALNDEIFTIIPGTASPEKIKRALEACDVCAIYKPSALHDIKSFVNFEKILRVDFAGIPEREKIVTGPEALENLNNYMSILLLWRKKS